MPLIDIESHITNEPLRFQTRKIFPVSKSIHLHLPGGFGGLIWNWPDAILVVSDDGKESIIKIDDPTRKAILGITMFCIAGLFLGWYQNRRSQRTN